MKYVGYTWGQDSAIHATVIEMRQVLDNDDFIATYTDSDVRHSDWPELRKAITRAKRAGAVLFIARLGELWKNVSFLTVLERTGVDFECGDYATVGPDKLPDVLALARKRQNKGQEKRSKAIAQGHDRNTKQAYAQIFPLMKRWRKEGLSQQQIADKLNEEGHKTRPESSDLSSLIT